MTDLRWVVTVSGLFTNEDGKLLLVRPPGRGWEPPGGRVEPEEGPLQAILREVREESGCEVRVDRLVGVETRVSDPPMVLFMFAGAHLAGEPAPSHETEAAGWFSVDEALALVGEEHVAARLRDALAGHPGAILRAYRRPPYVEIERRAF